MAEKKDYYKILGVSKSASRKEIKKAYHKLFSLHKGNEEFIKEIEQAYQVLSDKKKKRKYDKQFFENSNQDRNEGATFRNNEEKISQIYQKKWWETPFYIFWTLVMAFILWEGVYLPYKTNVLIREYTHIVNDRSVQMDKRFKFANFILRQAIEINSPYTVTDARKRGGWGFLSVLTSADNIEKSTSAKDLYKYITSQMEIALKKHPFDPQNYYILGQLYTFGGYRFKDLAYYKKAEDVFKKALDFSPQRTSFAIALARTYIFENKIETAKDLLHQYAYEYDPNSKNAHMLLGYIYFGQKEYKKAEKEFKWLKDHGYPFWKNEGDYIRYVALFDKLNDVNEIIDISQKRVDFDASSSRAWFNLAVAYQKIGKTKEAREAFKKAEKLNKKDYSKYEPFFKSIENENKTSTNKTSTEPKK